MLMVLILYIVKLWGQIIVYQISDLEEKYQEGSF